MYTDKTRNWSKDGLAIDLSVPRFFVLFKSLIDKEAWSGACIF